MEFLEALSPLTALSTGVLAVAIGVIARLSGLAFFLPGLGDQMIPVQVRLGAVLALSLVLTPIVLSLTDIRPSTTSVLTVILIAEAISGLLIGFSIRVAVYAIQVAGSIAAQGMSLSQLFGGIDDSLEPPIATLLTVAAIALAVSLGLHFQAVRALAFSFDALPFGSFPDASNLGEWATTRVAFVFSTALALSLPFVVLGFVYNLAIGAMNRAMPQLMVAFVGAPAVSLAGFALLAASAPVILDAWRKVLNSIMAPLVGSAL
ncbi:MAG: flagellar biosynthetic protein FliR [Pseudomonadota bacterium]